MTGQEILETANDPLCVRTAHAADIERILDLLEDTEFVRPLTRDQLRPLFEYQWLEQKPVHGVVVEDQRGTGGYGGMVYSPIRRLGDVRCTVVSLGTLYIDRRYRARRTRNGVVRYSDEIVTAVLAQGPHVYTAFSARGPKDVVVKLLTDRGFEELSSAELFYEAGSAIKTLLFPAGSVVTRRQAVEAALDEEQRVILRHHEPYGCRFFVIRERGRYCFLVTKRRRYRGEWLWPSITTPRIRKRAFPITDVLHVSDPDIAIRSWGRFVARASLIDRTVGVSCTDSFLGPGAPGGTAVPQRILVHGRTCPSRLIDKLYSEIVLLP